MWRGPAYADLADEEFVRPAAQRLEELRLVAVEELAGARLEAGEHALVAADLAGVVARHPLRERLRALYLRALYRAGRPGEALASYADLRERLADELGLDPGPELVALHAAILRQDEPAHPFPPGAAVVRVPAAPAPAPAAPATAAPAPAAADTPAAPPPVEEPDVRLPVPLTSLIGRDDAVAELVPLLSRARLVTLTGTGGVGKTRLALEVAAAFARDAAARIPDGVRLVELAGRGTGTDDLAQVAGEALGIRDDGTGPPADRPLPDRLVAALRGRRMLLVLDNCEHVVEAVADLVGRLVSGAPGLRVLATSREPLALTGETVFEVEPLRQDDAVRLFAERAAAAAPGFPAVAAADGTRELVAEVCRRLDGIPLALELAATRVRALGMAQLASRLDDRFRLLGSGARGAPARQQTLRATIDWSWNLLLPRERVVLARLAVHRNGCTLEAAEAVCAGPGVASAEVVDLLARLVGKSLVVVAGATGTAAPRYRLLESVAAYANERLDASTEAEAVRDRHVAYYLDLAERARPRLRGAGQREWLDRLDAESANLRAAIDAVAGPAVRDAANPDAGTRHADEDLADADRAGAERAERFGAALAWWWLLRGRPREASRQLARLRERAPASAELRLLHDAFTLLTGERPASPAVFPDADGPVASPAAQSPAARSPAADRPAPDACAVDACAVDACAVDTSAVDSSTLWLYAYGLFHAGDPAGAEAAGARALIRFEAAGDRWGTAAVLALRAMCALLRGDLAAAREDGLRGAGIFRALGDRWGEAQTVQPLAVLAEIRGDHAEATRRHHAGLLLARELGLRAEVCARLSGLGRLARLEHAWERARELHEEARRVAVEQGYKYGEVHALMGLALGARRSGDLDAAEGYLVHMRDAEPSSAAGRHLIEAELGFVGELRGDPESARDHHLRGLAVARSLGEPRAVALSLEGLAGAVLLAGGRAGIRAGGRAAGRADGRAHGGADGRTAAERAALLLGAADAARRGAGAPLPPAERIDVDRVTEGATAVLGPPGFAAAYARGSAYTLEQAVRLATGHPIAAG